MAILDPTRRRWDQTPQSRIVTTVHRVCHDGAVGVLADRAQGHQSFGYDATLEHLERHGPLPFIAGPGKPCLCKWLTALRRTTPELKGATVVVLRGAAEQALLAWSAKDKHYQSLALAVLEEQEAEDLVRAGKAPHPLTVDDAARRDHEPAPRLLRQLTREPRPCRRRRDTRRALRVAQPCTRVYERRRDPVSGLRQRHLVPDRWHLPGIGQVTLRDPIPDDANVRSFQLVETTRPDTPPDKRRYTLNVQCAHPIPDDQAGIERGIDRNVVETVATSDGDFYRRPDTSALETEAKALRAHARTRCKRESNQYRALHAAAKRLTDKAANIHDNWECHTAKKVVEGASLVVTEDLSLRNMSASGRGTTSAPGSQRKRGLNRSLVGARLGKLDRRIERRCLKVGASKIKVPAGGTSITCPRCGHRDGASRRGPVFRCTACHYEKHADTNAAVNITGRGVSRFSAWKARHRGAGRSSGRDAGGEAGDEQRGPAAIAAASRASRRARARPRNANGFHKATTRAPP